MDLSRGLRPVDGAEGFIQHGSKAHLGRVLGLGGNLALGCEPGKGLAEKSRPQLRQAVQKGPCRLIFPDGGAHRVDHIPGVHFPHQIHGGDTGLLFPVQHRPLVGRGAPVLGKQTGMDIDAAVFWNIQHLLGQDPSVGNHRANIRLQCPQLFHRFFLPERIRLEHGDSGTLGQHLYRRGCQLHPPAPGAVRLGVYAYHLKAVFQNSVQAYRRNIRGAHKNNTHAIPPQA